MGAAVGRIKANPTVPLSSSPSGEGTGCLSIARVGRARETDEASSSPILVGTAGWKTAFPFLGLSQGRVRERARRPTLVSHRFLSAPLRIPPPPKKGLNCVPCAPSVVASPPSFRLEFRYFSHRRAAAAPAKKSCLFFLHALFKRARNVSLEWVAA